MPSFLSGQDLAASFYAEVVAPRVADIVHSAALIGTGSDVLGYDDVRSTDHGWGTRLQMYVAEPEVQRVRRALDGLPDEHRGWPTRIGSNRQPLRVQIDVWTVSNWVISRLGVDPRPGLSTLDWLSVAQQLLLETTAGRVFHDGLGELEHLRVSLAWYPHDVWLWLLAAQWHRIGQEEAFVGRAADVGDDLGSRVVTGRLVRDAMRCVSCMRRPTPVRQVAELCVRSPPDGRRGRTARSGSSAAIASPRHARMPSPTTGCGPFRWSAPLTSGLTPPTSSATGRGSANYGTGTAGSGEHARPPLPSWPVIPRDV